MSIRPSKTDRPREASPRRPWLADRRSRAARTAPGEGRLRARTVRKCYEENVSQQKRMRTEASREIIDTLRLRRSFTDLPDRTSAGQETPAAQIVRKKSDRRTGHNSQPQARPQNVAILMPVKRHRRRCRIVPIARLPRQFKVYDDGHSHLPIPEGLLGGEGRGEGEACVRLPAREELLNESVSGLYMIRRSR